MSSNFYTSNDFWSRIEIDDKTKNPVLKTKKDALEWIAIEGLVYLNDTIFDGWREDRDVVLEAVKSDWINYVHTDLNDTLRNDKEIFLAAHWHDVRAFMYAGKEIVMLCKGSGISHSEKADIPIRAAIQLDKRKIEYKAGDDLIALLKTVKFAEKLEKCLSTKSETVKPKIQKI